MINRVGNNYYTNQYANQQKKVSKTDENAPAFLLNYDEDGVVWERDEKSKDKQKRTESDAKETENKSDNDLGKKELFSNSDEKDKAGDSNREKAQDPFSFTEVVKIAFNSIRSLFKAVFDFVWYGDSEKEKAEIENADKEKVETEKAELEKVSASAPALETKKSETEFDRKLSEAKHGVHGQPARNTELLTTYDKRGNIRKVSPSDSDRILKGDKSMKL